jgi:peptide/nickel transport system substrate-binding protein
LGKRIPNKMLLPVLLITVTLSMPLLQYTFGQTVRHPVVFVYSMEANFQPEGHMNNYAEVGYIWHAGVNMFEQLAPHILGTTTYKPELAESWSFSGDWLTVNLRHGVTWHDGQPFTSRDVWGEFMLRRLRGYSEWSAGFLTDIEDVQIVDDYTIKFHLKRALKDLGLNYILSAYMYAPYHIYKNYIDAYVADPERADEVGAELNAFNPKTVADGAVGTGPFMLVNMTESDLWMKKYSGFWAADKIVIDYIHGIKEPNNEVGWGYFFSNTADWGEPFSPVSVADALTEQGVKVLYAKSTRHDFIVFNHARGLLSDKSFRQALAYSINRTELVLAANYPVFHPVDYVVPFSGMYVRNWLNTTFLESLNKYEYDLTRANQIFTQLGLRKNDKGQLTFANGTIVTLYVKFPAPWTDIALMMQNLATQLNKVGITTIPLALDWASVERAELDGDFDIVWDAIGGDHPYLQGYDTTAAALAAGFPKYASFPKVVQYQGSSFNITQFFVDWGNVGNVDEQKRYVAKLAALYNDQLFALPFADVDAQFYGSDRFNYPPSYDDAWMCTDYARGIVVAQLFWDNKFTLTSYWTEAPPAAKPIPTEYYIIGGLGILVIALAAVLLLRRKP